MAYQTSTASSPNDLLGQLRTFAEANGWTMDATAGTGGDPASNQRVFNDGAGGIFATIPQNAAGEIHLQPCVVFNSGSTAFYDQLGSPNNISTVVGAVKCGHIPNGSSFTYHFFLPNSAPRYIHVAMRNSSGVFTHLAFGTCQKFGTFVGGQYASALAYRTTVATSNAFMFADADVASFSQHWVRSDGAHGEPTSRTISGASNSADTVTVTAHGYVTADGPVYLVGGSLPAGLNATTNYFLRNIDANTVAFFLTAANASANTSRVAITADGGSGTINSPGWYSEIGFVQTNALSSTTTTLFKPLYPSGLINLTQRTPFCPNYLKAELSGAPGNTVFVGQTPDLRLCSMEGRNPDGEIVTIGSDDWYIFPASEVGSSPSIAGDAYLFTGAQPNHKSNHMGYAYRKIT